MNSSFNRLASDLENLSKGTEGEDRETLPNHHGRPTRRTRCQSVGKTWALPSLGRRDNLILVANTTRCLCSTGMNMHATATTETLQAGRDTMEILCQGFLTATVVAHARAVFP